MDGCGGSEQVLVTSISWLFYFSADNVKKKKKRERTSVPELWAAVHQVKDLSGVQELLELA